MVCKSFNLKNFAFKLGNRKMYFRNLILVVSLLPLAISCVSRNGGQKNTASDSENTVNYADIKRTPEQQLDAEVARGSGEAYLETMRRTAFRDYLRVMRKWVTHTAQAIRNEGHLPSPADADYGYMDTRIILDEASPVKLVSPLLLTRYLEDLDEQRLPVDLSLASDLHILFALSQGGYRDVLKDPLVALMKMHLRPFLTAFRRETPQVQVRLVSLFETLENPDIVRELMWLSQYHKDTTLRSVSSRILDTKLEGR